MKNGKKRVALIAVLAVAVILLTACGGGNIEGTWLITKTAGTGWEGTEITAADNMTITFKDGKYTMAVDGTDYEYGTYKTSGKELTLDGDLTEYNINGDTLTIIWADATMTLKKK